MEKQMMENFLLDSIKDSLIYWKYFKFRWDTAAKKFEMTRIFAYS